MLEQVLHNGLMNIFTRMVMLDWIGQGNVRQQQLEAKFDEIRRVACTLADKTDVRRSVKECLCESERERCSD